jgi:CDGSH-type Zn-finger protein
MVSPIACKQHWVTLCNRVFAHPDDHQIRHKGTDMSKGAVAGNAPIKIDVEAGKTYYWCSCGKSSKQPFCDGSHKGSEFSPMPWSATEDATKFFCSCKQTGNAPFCDGSHAKL